jgi:hypothetical protein
MNGLAHKHRAAVVAAITTASLALGATSAQAVTCNQSLTDAEGMTWQQVDGVMQVTSGGTYQFNMTGQLPSSGLSTYPAGDVCTLEDGGREIAIPAQTPPNGSTLQIERKVFVSAGQPAFVRFFDTYRNPTGAPQTVDLAQFVPTTAARRLRTTSSGDALATTADDWAVTANTPAGGPAPTLPVVAEIWSPTGFSGRRPSGLVGGAPTQPWVDDMSSHGFTYEDVEIPSGGSVSMMHLVLLRPVGGGGAAAVQDAADDAATLAGAPGLVYEGLSGAEQERLINWPPFDTDGDGVRNQVDNCASQANPDQVDSDGDAEGNACDSDDDGDGLPDALESALGGDPLVADSDGDGVPDGRDWCIKLAGETSEGCPAPSAQTGGNGAGSGNGGGSSSGNGGGGGGANAGGVPQAPAESVDRTAPSVALDGVPSKMKLKTFLKGVSGKARCDEPCSFDFELLGSAKSVRLASTSDVVLGTRSLGLAGGSRAFKVKPSKKLVGDAKKLKVRLRIVATDASNNRTVVTKTITVK